MKHLKSLNYCKRMIKSTSAFGNASKGFASNELAQTDKSLKDQAVKLSLMLVSGALVWANNGLIEEAKAQSGYWEQAQKQQEEQQRQQQWLNDQEMLRQQNEEYYRQQQEAEARLQQERAEYNRQHPLGEPYVPAPKQKPSSYGAVAENKKTGLIGTSSNQSTKRASTELALQRCGNDCEITMTYSNQCMAYAYGTTKKGTGVSVWNGLTQSKAERKALLECSKRAKNCKILLSECSLP